MAENPYGECNQCAACTEPRAMVSHICDMQDSNAEKGLFCVIRAEAWQEGYEAGRDAQAKNHSVSLQEAKELGYQFGHIQGVREGLGRSGDEVEQMLTRLEVE